VLGVFGVFGAIAYRRLSAQLFGLR